MARGIGIAAAVLGMYYAAMRQGQAMTVGRTLVIRSFTQSVFRTLRMPNWVLSLMLAGVGWVEIYKVVVRGQKTNAEVCLQSIQLFLCP